MYLTNKSLFDQTARDWAVKYAGAVAVRAQGRGADNPGGPLEHALATHGIDPVSVERYTSMGFDWHLVVEKMNLLGIKRVEDTDGGEVGNELLEALLA